MRVLFISHNALGDTLCITPALRAYRRTYPEAHITFVTHAAGYTRVLDDNPDIDYLLYSDHLLFNGLEEAGEDWLYSLPLDFRDPQTVHVLDMRQFCTTQNVFERHISEGFASFVNIAPARRRPYVYLRPRDRWQAGMLAHGRYAVLSFHSNSNPEREDGRGRRKDWPMENWPLLCEQLRRAGIEDIVAIGSEYDQRYGCPHWRNLYGLPIRTVAALLEQAACVVTLESGIGHLAHAVDAPMVMLYSDLMPRAWADPCEATNCRVLYGDPHTFSPAAVMERIQEVLAAALSPAL